MAGPGFRAGPDQEEEDRPSARSQFLPKWGSGLAPAGPSPFFSSHLLFLFGASRGRLEIKPLVPHGCFIESGWLFKKTKPIVLFYIPSSLHVERQKPAQCREKTMCGPGRGALTPAVLRGQSGWCRPQGRATSCLHSVPQLGAPQALCLPLTGRHPDEDEPSRGHLGVGGR